jgi:flagellar basal body-associated protein FliL
MVLGVATIAWIALISWIVTAAGGFVLLSIWIARGGLRQSRAAGNRIRPPLILSHFLLAAGGLVVWIIYLAADKDALAWIALAVLGVVAVLGWTMFFIWYAQRGRHAAVEAHSASPGGVPAVAAEQHFPVAIVALHGLLAVTTVVLVLLAAAGVGGS